MSEHPGISRAIDLLACPHCAAELNAADGGVRCGQGHSFDIARQGYLNLLGGPQPANADTAAMIAARHRVHDTGVFAPLRELLNRVCGGRRAILEVGAGTGAYLKAALGEAPDAVGVALDISTAAAKAAAKTDPRIAAVVADVWQRLPLREASMDAVLAVFAPRNVSEFARVLKPSGQLVVVTPDPDHLIELRTTHQLLGLHPQKAAAVAAQAAQSFEPIDRLRHRSTWSADAELVADLIAMGPNAHHHLPDEVPASELTVAVTIQVFGRSQTA
jgi:Methylase involved in ubiquinone/menaquinone biosynthesis